jgi:hypothetical protein
MVKGEHLMSRPDNTIIDAQKKDIIKEAVNIFESIMESILNVNQVKETIKENENKNQHFEKIIKEEKPMNTPSETIINPQKKDIIKEAVNMFESIKEIVKDFEIKKQANIRKNENSRFFKKTRPSDAITHTQKKNIIKEVVDMLESILNSNQIKDMIKEIEIKEYYVEKIGKKSWFTKTRWNRITKTLILNNKGLFEKKIELFNYYYGGNWEEDMWGDCGFPSGGHQTSSIRLISKSELPSIVQEYDISNYDIFKGDLHKLINNLSKERKGENTCQN